MNEIENTNTMPAVSTMDMMQLALQKGASIEQMQQLMALHRDWEANEARKSYTVAMSEFKANPPKIIRDKINKQYGSKYASLESFASAVNPALSKSGLSMKWITEQIDGKITVTCMITHALGHSDSVSLSGPPDKSGSKNELQQIKSTITYLQGATLQAITGLVSSDFCEDDDGNSASTVQYITENQAADLEIMLTDTKSDKQKFLDHFKVDSLETFPVQAYQQAVSLLKAKQKKAS